MISVKRNSATRETERWRSKPTPPWWRPVFVAIVVWLDHRVIAQAFFNVSTPTASLIGHPAGPFSLDFQFIDGQGTGNGNNQITLSDFHLDGGGWRGSDPGSISLADTAFFSDFVQGIDAGGSLTFRVAVSGNANPNGTPDRFSFAILDRDGREIPTLGVGEALLAIDLGGPNPNIWTWATDLDRTDIVLSATAVAVPEPEGCLGLVSVTLAALGVYRIWRR